MKRGVLLNGTTVVNVCVFEDDFTGETWDGLPVRFVADDVRVAPGWVVDGHGFTDPNEHVPTHEEMMAAVEASRRRAYTRISDPLFFEWQRGTGTEQAWLDAVQAIKDANPYPEPS